MTDDATYEQKLALEAEMWGSESERIAQLVPPDWRCHRRLRHNVIIHGAEIDELLTHVHPGMKALAAVDRFLVRLKLLKNTGVVVYARKVA